MDLTQSNPTVAELPYPDLEIREALVAAAGEPYHPDPRGIPLARRAIAEHCGCDPDAMLLTSSTSEAYAALFKLLCDPGDEVLVPAPSYPLLEHLAAFEAARLRPYRLEYEGGWHIDFESLLSARTERTRAIVVIHPNNPTGHYARAEEVERLVEIGVPLISDEVFRTFVLDDRRGSPASLLQSSADLVFCLDGLSKRAALPQLKLGWIAVGGERRLVDESLERLELVLDCSLSVGGPVQHAAGTLLHASRVTHDAIVARARRNLKLLRYALRGSAGNVLSLEGGWNAVIRLPAIMTEEQWVMTLLERDGVWVQPGFFYDFDREAFIVVSLLTVPEKLEAAAELLRARIDAAVNVSAGG